MFNELADTARGYWFLLSQELKTFTVPARQKRNRKHLLLLAPFLPPFDNGGVHRPLSWLQYAKENGWIVSVLTRKFVGEPSKLGRYLQSKLPRCRMRYVHELTLRPSWSLFPRTDGSFLAALGSIQVGRDMLAEQDVSAIIATGPSFDLFITAFYLARQFSLPLFLDYRDEWTQNPHPMVNLGNADRFWEKRCLAAASAVTFTTSSMLAHYIRTFPSIQTKAVVLRNGWEPTDAAPCPSPAPKGPRLRILFAGTMGDATLPGAFLRDLAQIMVERPEWRNRIELYILGTRVPRAEKQIAEFPFPEILTIDGNRPKNEASALIHDSDAMLLLTPPGMERYIPGKLYDYLASGKPVIVHGRRGEAAKIVDDLKAGFIVSDSDGLHRALDKILAVPLQWNTIERQSWIMNHTRQQLARELFALLEKHISLPNMPRSLCN